MFFLCSFPNLHIFFNHIVTCLEGLVWNLFCLHKQENLLFNLNHAVLALVPPTWFPESLVSQRLVYCHLWEQCLLFQLWEVSRSMKILSVVTHKSHIKCLIAEPLKGLWKELPIFDASTEPGSHRLKELCLCSQPAYRDHQRKCIYQKTVLDTVLVCLEFAFKHIRPW